MDISQENAKRDPEDNSVPAGAIEIIPKEPPPSDSTVGFMWQAFANVNEWIRFSDVKATVILAADAAIVGAFATVLAGNKPAILQNISAAIWIFLVIIGCFFSASYALLSLMPQLLVKAPSYVSDHDSPPENKGSLVFFKDIANQFPDWIPFHSAISNRLSDHDGAMAELSQQIWANSRVAATKYRRIELSIRGLSFAVFVGFIGIIILAANYVYHNGSPKP